MAKIFLSYRREDTIDIAGRIDDRLSPYFGREAVFFDETIGGGDDFRDRLRTATGGCKVLLAIIGPGWLEARHAEGPASGGRRLDDPKDYVRFEIETVLRRDTDARVVPVLVGWAPMPKPEELPEAIRELAYRQAIDVPRNAPSSTPMRT